MQHIDHIQLPPAQVTQAELYGLVNAIRLQETTYKSSGSVHACALFQGEKMLMFVEDVGRHNAVDKVLGWRLLRDEAPVEERHRVDGRRRGQRAGRSRRRLAVRGRRDLHRR
jgi:FdhD protein